MLGLSAENPVASTLLAGSLVPPVTRFGAGLVDQLMGGPYRREREAIRAGRDARRAIEKIGKDVRQAKMQMLVRLASLHPDIYNKVLAGMDLPKQATILGGGARTDLADRLAEAMVAGNVEDMGILGGTE